MAFAGCPAHVASLARGRADGRGAWHQNRSCQATVFSAKPQKREASLFDVSSHEACHGP
jgi:hypothetical protein